MPKMLFHDKRGMNWAALQAIAIQKSFVPFSHWRVPKGTPYKTFLGNYIDMITHSNCYARLPVTPEGMNQPKVPAFPVHTDNSTRKLADHSVFHDRLVTVFLLDDDLGTIDLKSEG